VDTSLLAQELEPLNAQIEQLQDAVSKLEGELRVVEAEFEVYATDQQRFDVLQEACGVLDKLDELGAGNLFWDGLQEGSDAAGHGKRLRAKIAKFAEQTRGIQEQRTTLKGKIDRHLDELDEVYDEVRQVYSREERRQEEFLIERELTPLPYRPVVMPWAKQIESERRFRKALMISMFWSLLLGIIIPLVSIPIPDRAKLVIEIPERVAMLVKETWQAPPPVVERHQEPEKPEETLDATKKPADTEKNKEVKKPAKPQKTEEKPAGGGTQVARKKAEKVGVLAFKSDFSDLMDEVPVAKLGTEARLKKNDPRIPGQARAQRSLVAMQATGGGSSGINNYGVSRNLGNGGSGGGSGYGNAGQIGGVGTGKVESSVAGLTEEAGRPLSDGMGAARTDEEIQIVFDRYKATLYRIYNKELRKDPTLRGKLLMRLTIEPGGEVSLCKVESTDLASPELVGKILERVRMFNFGPKEDVPATTILYPIDFLPAG